MKTEIIGIKGESTATLTVETYSRGLSNKLINQYEEALIESGYEVVSREVVKDVEEIVVSRTWLDRVKEFWDWFNPQYNSESLIFLLLVAFLLGGLWL